MKKIIMVLMVLLMMAGCGASPKKEFKVGVIQWGEHPALIDSLEGMKQGLEESGNADRFSLDVKNANEDVGTSAMIASQFVNEKVDVIFAIATPAAQAAMNAVEGTDIPVVFSAVSDAKQAGLVENPDKPEGNITGVSDLPPLNQQVSLIKEMLPKAKSVGILFNTSEINSRNQIEEVKEIGKTLDLEVVDKGVSATNEIAIAAQQLVRSVDALFIVNDNMIASATGLVVDVASKENKPVFMAEVGQFEHGILASDSVSYMKLGKQAGRMISDIVVEKKLTQDIPVEISEETELFFSEDMAEKLSIEIPATVKERGVVR